MAKREVLSSAVSGLDFSHAADEAWLKLPVGRQTARNTVNQEKHSSDKKGRLVTFFSFHVANQKDFLKVQDKIHLILRRKPVLPRVLLGDYTDLSQFYLHNGVKVKTRKVRNGAPRWEDKEKGLFEPSAILLAHVLQVQQEIRSYIYIV